MGCGEGVCWFSSGHPTDNAKRYATIDTKTQGRGTGGVTKAELENLTPNLFVINLFVIRTPQGAFREFFWGLEKIFEVIYTTFSLYGR